MSFDALQSCVVSASATLWLIVDPRWGAGARWAFPPALGQGKSHDKPQGRTCRDRCSGLGLFGVMRKNCTRLDRMSGAPATDPSYVLQSRSAAFDVRRDAPRLDLSWSALCVAQNVGEVLS
jgi:hypothetical protein